jgi:hypothetical protein
VWLLDVRHDDENIDTAESDSPLAGAAGAPALRSEPKRNRKRAGAVSGASAVASSQDAAGSPAEVECDACRKKACTNYEDQGINMLSGCFEKVDGSQGADTNDPTFVSDCTAAVRCAMETHCATSPVGAAACYCGSRSIDECVERGPSADAPCTEQWMRAARTHDHHELTLRFSDLKYPAGWANFMLECDRVQCRGKCARGGDPG